MLIKNRSAALYVVIVDLLSVIIRAIFLTYKNIFLTLF